MNGKSRYRDLGCYGDWAAAARRSRALYPPAAPGKATQRRLLEALSFAPGPARPRSVRVEARWCRDGVDGQAITWSVGYGPRTEAWLLRPHGVRGRLPGVLAFHDHGAFKYFGKEKIADGPGEVHETVRAFREACYGGRAFANVLAKEGYAVLVPDVFCWGSRKFPLELLARSLGRAVAPFDDRSPAAPTAGVGLYNELAAGHEHIVEKYCTLLGTTLSGVMSFEDRVSAAYLLGRRDVRQGAIGALGLSGGGLRTALLQATCDRVGAAVVVGLMSTYESLLDQSVGCHTWAFFPRTWPLHGDWPDIAACRAPSPLMVQYDLEDTLFSEAGMRAADRRIRKHYQSVGRPDRYVGRFYPGPHKFDLEMQADAFAWLGRELAP